MAARKSVAELEADEMEDEDMDEDEDEGESENGNGTAKLTKEERIAARRPRFLKLAPKRVNQVLQALGRLQNCANTANYEYTQNEVASMFDAIYSKLDVVKDEYATAQSNAEKPGFTF